MMINMVINYLNNKLESLYTAKYKEVVTNFNHSQAFLFGVSMGKFRRKKVLGKCKYCNNNAYYKFKNGVLCCENYTSKCPTMKKKSSERTKALGSNHPSKTLEFRKSASERMLKNNPMKNPEIVAKISGENSASKRLEVKKNMSKAQTGKKRTTEHRKNISNSIKALGNKHPCKNIKIRKKISDKNKGKKHSKEFCKMRSKIQSTKCGPLAPNWQGGKSFEEYCEIWKDKEYKDDIRKRDDYYCQNPYCRGNCNHFTLIVHHIDGSKKNCHPSNLISICRSCNKIAEGNKNEHPREWWEKLYQSIMTEKYGYKY